MNENISKAWFLFFWIFSLVFIFPDNTIAAKELGGSLHVSVGTAPFHPKEKIKYNLNVVQPYSFELETIKKCMAGIAYQEREISWSKKKRIFSDAAIARLSPLIIEHFTKADKNHLVLFKVKKPSGKIMIKGDTFLTPMGMHWRFTTLNYIKRKVGEVSIMGDPWRLVPRRGQTFKSIQPYNNLIQNITNWIVFEKFRPEASRLVKVPPQTKKEVPSLSETSSEKTSEIKKRLEILEKLKKEELINEDEYRMKRLEILKSF